MGDAGYQYWMPPRAPLALPLGKANIYPSGDSHAVSVSLPTWNSVIGLSRKEAWVMDMLEWSYPRFYINKPVKNLCKAVLQRLQITDDNVGCMLFRSAHAARQLSTTLENVPVDTCSAPGIDVVRFSTPLESDTTPNWANFSAVLFPLDLWKHAMGFWRDTGAGLSTRHAEFCLSQFDYLDSDSTTTKALRTLATRKSPDSLAPISSSAADEVKSVIAELATGEVEVHPGDVFLYPNGMNAIYALSETLSALEVNSKVAAYGWIYPETIEVLRRSAWGTRLFYKNGTEEELDQLEQELESGLKIHALFTELPSNIKLSSPNLPRIRALADRYGFIVACDDTVAGYVNIDAIPYVDVMMSSLTKTFSGVSNVTGGSLVLNPRSVHYDTIHAALLATYECTYFPPDVDTLLANCRNIVWRVSRCNESTLPIVDLLQKHPLVAQVNHPSIGPTAPVYKSLMRKNGGYGNVLSIIFHDPSRAEYFYNTLNVCKGSSFGTNFTLAIPYVQLANYWQRDKVPKYGVPQHIIRLSVGLEDTAQIVKVVAVALEETEKH
ncbi:cystathionine gamma-synthase [Talaromyces islandicus]|uniref:Cystathionine gamma-synthase n=1 Tax=Talaromyces islandicus TaxID=28573 RepID=A0A0U1M7U4_TALIS|nr:cystathionine gamma-synthase [Talaromyces islandicus]